MLLNTWPDTRETLRTFQNTHKYNPPSARTQAELSNTALVEKSVGLSEGLKSTIIGTERVDSVHPRVPSATASGQNSIPLINAIRPCKKLTMREVWRNTNAALDDDETSPVSVPETIFWTAGLRK
jgi:hypothetical protein